MKKYIALILGLTMIISTAGCGADKNTSDTDETATAEETETTTEDIFEGAETDTSPDTIGRTYAEYEDAVNKTLDIKDYTSSSTINVSQESDNADFVTSRVNKTTIDVKSSEKDSEELRSIIQDIIDGEESTVTLYYKDGTVYTEESGYKIKAGGQTFSDLNPRYADIISELSFDETAVTGVEKADDYCRFLLDPDKVDFGDTFAVPVEEMNDLTLTYCIDKDMITEASFSYAVDTTARNIQESNREAIEANGGTIDEISDEDNAEVHVTCTATTAYSNIDDVDITFPDFSDYRTTEEVQAEIESIQAAQEAESASAETTTKAAGK